MKKLLATLFLVSSAGYAQVDNRDDIVDKLNFIEAKINLLLRKDKIEGDCALYLDKAGYKSATLYVDYAAGLYWHSDLGGWWSAGCQIYIKDLLDNPSDSFSFLESEDLHEKYGPKSKIKPKKKSKKDCGE